MTQDVTEKICPIHIGNAPGGGVFLIGAQSPYLDRWPFGQPCNKCGLAMRPNPKFVPLSTECIVEFYIEKKRK